MLPTRLKQTRKTPKSSPKKEQPDTVASLSRYYTSHNVELLRSEIHFANYTPRRIDPENLKTLKRGIKKFWLVGGIVVNSRTDEKKGVVNLMYTQKNPIFGVKIGFSAFYKDFTERKGK